MTCCAASTTRRLRARARRRSCGSATAARISSYLVAAAVLAVLATPAAARKGREKTDDDLLNVLLSPGLAGWLAGPIAHIATEEEIRAYQALTDDAAARTFVDAFWQKRSDSASPWPGRQLRDVFEGRANTADRLFTEGISLGRNTDRGTTYVLYGPPEDQSYTQGTDPRKVTVEIWSYGRESALGLDGLRPKQQYYFAKRGAVTVFSQRPEELAAVPEPRRP